MVILCKVHSRNEGNKEFENLRIGEVMNQYEKFVGRNIHME